MTSPPSALNFTAISSSVMGSRGSPLGTSTRVEYSFPSFVVIVTRLGWNLGKSASNSSFAMTFTLSMIGISDFLRVGPILVWIAKNIRGARDHFYFDLLYVVRLNLVFLDGLHHGSERR